MEKGGLCRLDAVESGHCVRVLRHRVGEVISLMDGRGTLIRARITRDDPRGAEAQALETFPNWHPLPYRLVVGCCLLHAADRYEWFVEKATELGVTAIVPLLGERSACRKTCSLERLSRIALSAAKQSLKAKVPDLLPPVSVTDFLSRLPGAQGTTGLGLVACCFEEEGMPRRVGIGEALRAHSAQADAGITLLIGPEGDFSPGEVRLAVEKGFLPVHLGPSRLRTETAAVTGVEAVYLSFADNLDFPAHAHPQNG